MWSQIKQYLVNIGDYPYSLFVTMNEEDDDIIRDIKQFHKETSVFIVENKGYDIGPFVYFLNKIDLSKYDLILKIHTKDNKAGCDTLLNHRYVSRKYWFQLLIEALIGSKRIVLKNINAFQNNKKLGMIGSKYCITSNYKNAIDVKDKVIEIMNGFNFTNFLPITFVAGTMFFVRSKILQKVKENYTINDFDITDNQVKDGTLAHALERVFGCLVIAQGYQIQGYDRNRSFEYQSIAKLLQRFIFQKKITKKNYLQVKILKFPIYHRKII